MISSKSSTAITTTSPLWGRIQSLSWIVGVLLAILIVARWIQRGGLTVLGGRGGGVTLIVLGAASLLTCVFPLLGLVAILCGIVVYLRARFSPATA